MKPMIAPRHFSRATISAVGAAGPRQISHSFRECDGLHAAAQPGRVHWLLGLACCVFPLLMQSQWDAPINFAGGSSAQAMAAVVSTGYLPREIFGALLSCAAVLACYVNWPQRAGMQAAGRILMIWLGWLALTVFTSSSPALSLKRFYLLFMIILAAYVCASLTLATILRFVGILSVLQLAVGFASEVAHGTFAPLQASYRFAGLTHPNLQGAALAIGILASLGEIFCATARSRGAWYRALACLIGLHLTHSRTSEIALGCGLVAAGLILAVRRSGRHSRAAHVPAIALLGLASVMFLVKVYPSFQAMILAPVSAARDAESGGPEELTGRVDLWKLLAGYVPHHLLMGYGYDAFWSSNRIADVSQDEGWAINEAHSGYLDLLLTGGIPSAALFIALLAGMIWINGAGVLTGDREGCIWLSLAIFVTIHALTESIMLPFTFPSFVLFVGAWRTGLRTKRIPFPATLPWKLNNERVPCQSR